jgi:hypothetical protein
MKEIESFQQEREVLNGNKEGLLEYIEQMKAE